MPQKGLTKTRWTIDDARITIYPYRVFFIFSIVLGVLFGGLLLLYITVERNAANTMGSVALLLAAIVILFLAYSRTQIIFDRTTGSMQQKMLGLIPIRTIPFDRLHGVNTVTQQYGGFNFRIFPKNNKYGKGIIISSGYGKETDPNAIAFSQEVIPLIHEYIAQYTPLAEHTNNTITAYKYFNEKAGVYILKNQKAGTIIMGIALLALGIHECTGTPWIKTDGTTGRIVFIVISLGLGLIFLLAAFTRILLNPAARTIERISPIGIGNKKYAFEDFSGFRTVRKSYNMIYAGTEVQMFFTPPNTKQPAVVVVSTIRQSRKIERFIEEIKSIMEK
ncbi:MAG TPA: hypothetical protein VIM87_30265 [Chitinophaga sp.]|uniref:hypothetical protein n=1 Tax=Chitinophaga sp. TaxID=1869181 RepID=UPI002F927942